MKFKFLAALALAATLYSCDDDTTGIGNIVADYDQISASASSYPVSTRTVLLDSIYSRTSTAYLGKFTEEYFGEFNADFLAQINWPENYRLPSTTKGITNAILQLFYSSYYGDSLATMRLQVDTLSQAIMDNGTDKNLYYSNLNPEKFYNPSAPAFATKDYTAYTGVNKGDSVAITLHQDFCDYLFRKYEENDHANFNDGASFINNVLKGFYIHTIGGDGCVLYINDIYLNLVAEYTIRNSADTADSTVYTRVALASSKEVFMSTRFRNANLTKLPQDKSCTYLKTPAGVCTEMVLPLEEIYNDPEHQADTLNAASLTIKKYKNASGTYAMGTPTQLLMVRKDDMKAFFEGNKIYDNKTSFASTYSSTSSSYTFTQLNRLVSHIFSEIRPEIEKGAAHWAQWKADHPNWNKVLLVPVSLTTDSNGNVIGVENDMSVTSATLYGGEDLDSGRDADRIRLQVIYTHPVKK